MEVVGLSVYLLEREEEKELEKHYVEFLYRVRILKKKKLIITKSR